MHTSETDAAQAFESDTNTSKSDNKASDTDTKAFESDTTAFESDTKASDTATKAFDCSLFGLGRSEAINCCSMLVPELLMLQVGIEAERLLAGCRRSGQDESPHAY